MRAPPKVREFTWRAYWDIMPHGVNLAKRGVSGFIRCFRCGDTENLRHFLLGCPWAQGFWSSAKVSFEFPMGASFRDVVDWFWGSRGCEDTEVFVTLAWQLWKSRNEAIFKAVFDPPSLYVKNSLIWLREYQMALSFGLVQHSSTNNRSKWMGPFR